MACHTGKRMLVVGDSFVLIVPNWQISPKILKLLKMRHHHGSQIVIPTQVAHDLGDRQCRKWSVCLQTYGQQIG
jgi:hypothetical protein